jgi:hypothetical protein
MADYNVTSSDGTFTVNVQTGTINNNYDIPFIGQDAINYGDDLVAAQLRQLENFANTTAPAFGTTRVKGQLWYDSTPSTGRLNIFDGASWDVIPLDIDVVHSSGDENVAGIKTFTSAPAFTAAGAPITVNSDTVVPNLNADKLDGEHATAFATSSQGALADAAEPALPINSTPGYVLSETSGSSPNSYAWISPSVSAGQVQVVGSTLSTTTNLLLADNTDPNFTTGVQDPLYATGLSYNAATSTLSTLNFTGTFNGALLGNASTATTATTATNATNVTINSNDGNSGDTTTYPVLVAANTATNQTPHVDGGQLSYNATTGQLNATLFAGNGAAITNLNMSAGSHTGTLAVARGGTGVNVATGTGSAVVLHTSPTFVTEITVPNIAGTAVSIEGANVVQIQTQDHAASGSTTGAQVKANNGNLYDIGMNQLPIFNSNADDTLEAGHCGTNSNRNNCPHTYSRSSWRY